MHLAFVIFERAKIQLFSRKLKSGCSCSLSLIPCLLNNCLHTSISSSTVELHLIRSQRHPTCRTALFRSPIFERSAAQFSCSPSQLFSLSLFSLSFNHPMAPPCKSRFSLHKGFPPPSKPSTYSPDSTSLLVQHSLPAQGPRARDRTRAYISRNSLQLLSLAASHIPAFLMLQLPLILAPSIPLSTHAQFLRQQFRLFTEDRLPALGVRPFNARPFNKILTISLVSLFAE